MAYSTGLFWADQDSGLVDSALDVYGASGSIVTEETLKAAEAAKTIARIDCSNATAVMIMPLLGSIVTGSGNDDVKFAVYGVMPQGELSEPNAIDDDKFLFRLGTPVAALVTSNTITATSAWSIKTPGGYPFAHHANEDGDNHNMSPFVVPVAMSGSNIPDGDVGTLEDTETGFSIFPGINSFQQLVIAFDKGSLGSAQTFNALISLLY
jgi:hypothetical protein|tara:strand:+ start:285 stop:911 length:627 start_codon:yes stop_codon:yes gene_type:complete